MTEGDSNNFIKNRPFEAYDGDDEYIFISYSHKDADAVFEELKKFKGEGYNIWYDQGIDVGVDWDDAIAEALEGCALFVCFISKNSLASDNVINEIKFADDENKDIVLIYFEDIQLKGGLKLRLRNRQAILKFSMSPEEYARQWKKAFARYIHTESSPEPPKSHNFKYLDGLIHSGAQKVKLEFDIKIGDVEKSGYPDGIILDADGITIDGDNHFIDANDLTSIFSITGKNILIKNCTFKNGHNFHTDGSKKHEIGGGAVSVADDASVSFLDCKFLSNHSEDDGGAIFNKGGTVSLKNCTFENNSAKVSGGAIANFKQLDIFKGIFKDNKSHNGGGIYNSHYSTLTLRNSKFRKNSANMFGGAIYNYGDVTADECSFRANVSRGGGAILNYGSSTVSSTPFKLNSATLGGAILNMAKISISYSNNHSSNMVSDGYIKFIECNFASNSANSLGGVITNLSKSKFEKCIFAKNSASNISHIINNGPKGIKGYNVSASADYVSVLTLSDCEFRIGGDLEKNAVYNQERCLLSITGDTVVNEKPAEENSNIFSNHGKIEFE